MKYVISTLLAAFISTFAFAQERSGHWCGTHRMNQEVIDQNPDAFTASQTRLDQTSYNMQADAAYKNNIDDGRPFLIPCVFHVFHTEGKNPVSEQKIQEFVNGLNERYNPTASDIENKKRLVADEYKDVIGTANIKFVIAERDPKGNETNGITVTQWEHADGDAADRNEVKYQVQWNPSRYLNFWVVEAIGAFDDNPDQQVLGFAQFPSSFDAGARSTDGVVIRADQVNKNSTTGTHEVGHYLGLYHPFQGDGDEEILGCVTGDCHFAGDRICDLDQARQPVWTCQRGQNTCPLDDRTDPVNNYMMYTPDHCHHMFSKQQVTRMRATLLTLRYELSSWDNIVRTGIGDLTNTRIVYDANVYPNPFNDKISIDIESATEQQICITIKDLLGRTIQKDCKKKLSAGRNSITLSADEMNISERGVYLLELQLTDQIVISKIKYEN